MPRHQDYVSCATFFSCQFITIFVSEEIDIAIAFELRSKNRSINGPLDNSNLTLRNIWRCYWLLIACNAEYSPAYVQTIKLTGTDTFIAIYAIRIVDIGLKRKTCAGHLNIYSEGFSPFVLYCWGFALYQPLLPYPWCIVIHITRPCVRGIHRSAVVPLITGPSQCIHSLSGCRRFETPCCLLQCV